MNPNNPRYTTTKFGRAAIDAVYAGAREVSEAVATTLGPLGRNVLIDKGYQTDIIHDGVGVSLIVNPEDPFARNGANVMKEAAQKQRDEVGDGTTAVCILTQAILDETLMITASGINPMTLRRGLESGAAKVVARLQALSQPVTTLEQKTQIATISAEDLELGKLVAETIQKIGNEGILTVDESKALETTVEFQEGMQIDKGYAHQFMITDPERQTAVLEDVAVLITDHPLTDLSTIGKFLETVVLPNTTKTLFIAPEIGGDFLTALLGAKIQGKFLGVAVRAPGIGSMQTEMLQDICALTGATFISKEAGHTFDRLTFAALGKANRIICSKISTIIEEGGGHKEDILKRTQSIKAQMEDDTISDYEREQLKARLGRLTNGVAVIKVGGATEIEMKERKERAIDAVQATQSACKYGLVPGGEVAYLACLDELDERDLGEKILKNALKAPFKRLVENAGYDGGETLARMGQPQLSPRVSGSYGIEEIENEGFDVTDGQFKDMIVAGIIDPTSVPVTAVKTAVSVAVQLSSLGAAVVLNNEMPKLQ